MKFFLLAQVWGHDCLTGIMSDVAGVKTWDAWACSTNAEVMWIANA